MRYVDRFKYLGSMITADGRCESEIRIRLGKGCIWQEKGASCTENEYKAQGEDKDNCLECGFVWGGDMDSAPYHERKISCVLRFWRCGCGEDWRK